MTTRRNYLRGLGIAAGAASVGGLGVHFTSKDVSGASTVQMNIDSPGSVTTDDGKVEYVGFSGYFTYEWVGAEKPASHGQANLSATLYEYQRYGDKREIATKNWASETFELGIEEIRRYGTVGKHSPDSPTESGKFTFSSSGEVSGEYDTGEMKEPIVILVASSELQSAADSSGFVSTTSYSDPSTNSEGDPISNTSSGYVLVDDLFDIAGVSSDTDRQTVNRGIELTFTGQVFRSDPSSGTAEPAAPADSFTDEFALDVTNRGAAVTASGSGDGIIGANQK